MKIPMSWLNAYVPIETDLHTFMRDMPNTGSATESVEHLGADITKVVTGRVEKLEKHPNADKLWITQINTGNDKIIQIVTGAANLQVGDYVPVALDGATLADGKKIKRGKLRGEVSEGMLCSIDELGYTRQDYPEAPEDGIYVFQTAPPLGVDVRPLLELTDDVVDFDITSNRADCQSVLGMAREVAATYQKTFVIPPITLRETGGSGRTAADMIAVEIKNPTLCPRYIARVVENVHIAPSPQWLRHRLTASGVRPINNIVDITNYVMLEYGQPMHAFDIDNIAGRKIIVRNAAAGESFVTLDGIQRRLDASMLVIADCEKAVAVAGVMGGENSMVTAGASAILFESANFNGTNIRLTSKKLGLRTEASARYEKGLDPNLALAAVNRAMELVEQLGCGDVLPGLADDYPSPRVPWFVPYNPARINALLGTAISGETMVDLLARIGITTNDWVATIPTFRPDITGEADIAEEVVRFYGYDNITATLSQKGASAGGKNARQRAEDSVKYTMRALGYSEALTCTFESPRVFDKLLMPPDSPLRNAIQIQNPLGEDFCIMRTTSLNAMLQSLSVNYSRKNTAVKLFEAALVYRPKALPLTEMPIETKTLTFCAYDKSGTMDFYDFKGDMEQLLSVMGVMDNIRFAACSNQPPMHPGRTAAVFLKDGTAGEKPLGYFGEVHPQVAAHYQLEVRTYLAVLDLAVLYAQVTAVKTYPTYKPLPKYPSVDLDIALRVKQEVQAADLEAAIREKAGTLLAHLTLFDVYQGKQLEEGYKSMAYTLSFRSPERTLTDEDVSPLMQKILAHLQSLGAVLRDK